LYGARNAGVAQGSEKRLDDLPAENVDEMLVWQNVNNELVPGVFKHVKTFLTPPILYDCSLPKHLVWIRH